MRAPIGLRYGLQRHSMDNFRPSRNVTTPTHDSPSAANSSEKKKHSIVLIDDHPVTRLGIAAVVNHQPDLEVVAETDNAAHAVQLVTTKAPAVAVVDISLKTTNGIELIKNLAAAAAGVALLVVSMHDENIYAERALRAGARGYLMKQEASEKIVHAIRTVLKGEIYLSEAMRNRLLYRLVDKKKSDAVFPIDTLSDREMEVFQLIGQGFTTRQIAERLNLSVKTIDSYREHLKQKLNLTSGAELVRHAIEWVKGSSLG